MNKSTRGSILVVDDDPGVLKSTTSLLQNAGYHVIASANVDGAMKELQGERVEVVVTDIVMPHISGIDLLKEVHEIDPHIPVILMTGYADIEKMIDAIKIGAFDFIIKPVNIELFVHSVEKAINYCRMMKTEEDYKHLLEEYNREIETLVAERTMSLMALTIADKIRNPATVIGLTCRRLIDKEEDPAILKGKLHDIMQEAEKLDMLVTEFESLLRSRRSMFDYEDVNEHIDSVVTINRSNAESKGVEIILNISEYPLNINMQKQLFQSALSHLIKNSIEATPEGGSVTISTHREGNNAVLTVSDTGHGIETEVLDKIFDPMYSTKTQRFGMGLSLVKQIISDHMGEIDVESRTGEGTTFRIQLPLRWKEDTS